MGFRYLKNFYKGVTAFGALPFTIDLILDSFELTEHKAYFKPNTFTLTGQRGLSFFVTASIEAEPIVENVSDMIDFVGTYNNFNIDLFSNSEDLFNSITNIYLPGAL
jgi:hypothetical protein